MMINFLPVGEGPCGLHARDNGRVQAHEQRGAVEQHVEAVGHQAQAVGPHPVHQLNTGEHLETRDKKMFRCSS